MTTRTLFLCATFTLIACGGGDDDGVTVVDAPPPIDAPVDAAIDAFVCNPPNMTCAGACVDTQSSNEFCGDCNTACSGGTYCETGDCVCADITIPAEPSFFMPMLNDQLPGARIGIGPIGSGTGIDILVIAHPTSGTIEGMAYPLDGDSPGTPPFAAYGYDLDLNTFEPAAAYYATSGTLTFTKICPVNGSNNGGFSGTLTNAVFQAVDSIQNPVIVPDGCTINRDGSAVASVTFSYGDVSCTNQ